LAWYCSNWFLSNIFTMHYSTTMQATFESEKNRKAAIYTAIICGTLLILAFFITWTILPPTQPLAQDLIEINLGNNEEGFGAEQPLIKGQMSPETEAPTVTEQPQQVNTTPAAETVQPEEDAPDDAAPVTKTAKPVKEPNKSVTPIVKQPVKKPNTEPVAAPAPKPKNPVATYKGPGNGKGNGAEEDNGFRYQGNKAGGKGDAGDPSGKPDSYGNTPGGKTGVSVARGTRPLNLGQLRFEDDFNENAKVYVDVRYNSNGGFISATIAKGSTTANATILSIARRKAAELKFPASADGGISTILFNFKVQN
jgi:outer membrane biosynthesis protein TonB